MSLSGKSAIIVGSTAGLGLQIAKRLCREGAHVFISSRKQENVDSALDEFRKEKLKNVSGTVCHVVKNDDRHSLVKEVVKTFGKIDILVNNAGVNPVPMTKVSQISEAAFDKIMDTNVKAMFLLINETIQHMRHGSSIVCMSSIIAHRPDLYPSIYGVSKAALNCLVKSYCAELAERGIRINGISPGLFHTQFGNVLINHEYWSQRALNATALNRFGDPGEIAGLVSFLCSEDASYVTGEIIPIAGGTNARI